MLNNCINIENNIKDICIIEEKIKKFKAKEINIKFYPELDEDIELFSGKIKQFGHIFYNKYKFRKCPVNIQSERKYELNKDENIITKNDNPSYYSGAICVNELEKNYANKWKFKILKTKSYNIYLGIASEDFNYNSPKPNKKNVCWYFKCDDALLYSGPPNILNGLDSKLKKKGNEIIVIMDMNKGTLQFIIDNEDKGISFDNIPTDKPLFPSVLLIHNEDSVQIIEC